MLPIVVWPFQVPLLLVVMVVVVVVLVVAVAAVVVVGRIANDGVDGHCGW